MQTKEYKNIIKENKGKFNDGDSLIDFIESYTDGTIKIDITGLEDNINEYADRLVPIYYDDIVKEWAENNECHNMTIEQVGEYDGKGDIYKMMQQDLFFFYQGQLSKDYQTLLDLMTE